MVGDSRDASLSSTVFFERCYAFRSGNGLLSLLVLTVFGTGALWVSARRINNPPGQLETVVSTVFLLAGLGLLGCSIYVVYSILIDRRATVRISVEGIWRNQNCVPWQEVRDFYGTQYTNGISLGFTPRQKPIYFEKSLITTPLLTDKEYRELVNALREYHDRVNSGVDIALHPRIPSGD